MKQQTRTEQLATLRRTLIDFFDEEELETLCFDLGVDYDSLPAEGKANKARELVSYFERRERIPELVAKIRAERPNTADILPWDDLAPPAEFPAALTGSSRRPLLIGGAAVLLLVVLLALYLLNRNPNEGAVAAATPTATTSAAPTAASEPAPSPSPASNQIAEAASTRLTYNGQVLDADTGEAVRDAYVFISFPNVEEIIPLAPIQAGEDGTFSFRLTLIREQLTGNIHVSAPDYQPFRRDYVFTQDNAGTLIVARLEPAGPIVSAPVEEATAVPVTATPDPGQSPIQQPPPTSAALQPTRGPASAFPPERRERFDEIPLGVAIGDAQSVISTLGAKVFDIETGLEMILTLSSWQAGQAVYQPGGYTPSEEDRFAEVARRLSDPYIGSVAWLTGDRPVSEKTFEGMPILCATTPQLGMRVWKSGVGTGYTEGFIDALNVSSGSLEKLVRIVPLPDAEPGYEISGPGDGGTVWVDAASGRAIAMHASGERPAEALEYAMAQDINAILRELNVRLPGCEE